MENSIMAWSSASSVSINSPESPARTCAPNERSWPAYRRAIRFEV
jgi:hypothetical protein